MINIELPINANNYKQRIGLTKKFGYEGVIINIVIDKEWFNFEEMRKET